MATKDREDRIVGCLVGTAVGDALGLAMEGLSKRRRERIFGPVTGYHFFFGRGMVSDDTEHAAAVAQALVRSGGDPAVFARKLGWGLRWWFGGLPAGIGLATLRACVKLWIGFPPRLSGVFSAGNGPAMRAPVIGAAFGHDQQLMKQLVRASTCLTHTDPRAEHGALAAALAAHLMAQSPDGRVPAATFLDQLGPLLEGDGADEFMELMQSAAGSATAGESAGDFAVKQGQAEGVDGYMPHTMGAVIHCWLGHGADYAEAVREVIELGGDTDTTAAILGGIMGAGVGPAGIPREWIDGLMEWPRSVDWLTRLGRALAVSSEKGEPGRAPGLFYPLVLFRNLFFMAVVLAHGFRRLAPPY